MELQLELLVERAARAGELLARLLASLFVSPLLQSLCCAWAHSAEGATTDPTTLTITLFLVNVSRPSQRSR